MAIYIRAFRHHALTLNIPRTVVTPRMLGRTVGAPGDARGQRLVVLAALRLLETAETPGTILDLKE